MRKPLVEEAGTIGRLCPGAVVRCDEPLGRRTTLRVGGPADLYVEPAGEEQLAEVLRFSGSRRLPVFILGRGSNLIVRDGGFRGVVICLAHAAFSRIEVHGPCLHCGAGVRLKAAAIEARRNGLAGLEFLEGIPGSIGGGLRMNAGAMGSSLFDIVDSVRLMDLDGLVHEATPSALGVQYRSCAALANRIAVGVVLRGKPDSGEAIAERMRRFSEKRWNSQPAAPSAGCIFKNTPTVPAGRLVEELGLKRTRVGGAEVSSVHGNFIVTDATATARDVLELIDIIRQRARSKRGLELETEVEIIGECPKD